MCKANIKKYFFSLFTLIISTWIAISSTCIYFLISSDSMSHSERGMLITLIVMYPFVVYALLFYGLFGFFDWANITLNQDLFGQSSDRLSKHLKTINELSSNNEFKLNLEEVDWNIVKDKEVPYKDALWSSRPTILTEINGNCTYNNQTYKIKITYLNFRNFLGEMIRGYEELKWRITIGDKEYLANEPFIVEDLILLTKYSSTKDKIFDGYLRNYMVSFIEQLSLEQPISG